MMRFFLVCTAFFSFGLLQSLLLSAIALEVERSSC